MAEINKIFDDISGKSEKQFSQENDLFNELKQNLESHFEDETSNVGRIIQFLPFSETGGYNNSSIVKLAADSGDTFSKKLQSSEFLISKDGKTALKYKVVNKSVLQVDLLSGESNDIDELILYSKKLDRYFVSDLKGNYIIGQYENFQLTDFEFEAIFPFDKIKIFKSDGDLSAFSFKETDTSISDKSNDFIYLEIGSISNTRSAVIITSKTKDFLNISANRVEIPTILLEDRSFIYLY